MFEILSKAALHQRFGLTDTPEPEWMAEGVEIIRDVLIKNGSAKVHNSWKGILNEAFILFAEHTTDEQLLEVASKRRNELAVKISELSNQKDQYSKEATELSETVKALNDDCQVAIVLLDTEQETNLSGQVESLSKNLKNAQIRIDTASAAIAALTETHRAYQYIVDKVIYDKKRASIEADHNELVACFFESGLLEKLDHYQREMQSIGLTYCRPNHYLSDGQINSMRLAFTRNLNLTNNVVKT